MAISDIDNALRPLFDQSVNGLPGAVAVAVDANSNVVYQGTFGKESFDTGKPMTMDSICWLASQTKLMVAVAAMQCVERGLITLDEPIGHILPELADPDVIDRIDENGVPQLRKAKTKITLRLLLSHQTGLSYFEPENLIAWFKYVGKPMPEILSGKIEDYLWPLVIEPGSGWVYGVGIDWVGVAIGRLNKCTLGEFMDENIWKPLGMNSTSFHPHDDPKMAPRLASLHTRTSDGPFRACAPIHEIPTRDDLGGGGCYSTPSDYIKFLSAILRGGEGILRPESVEELYKPNLTGQGLIDMEVRKSYRYAVSPDLNYGLCTELNGLQIPEGRSAGTASAGGLPNLIWWIDRKAGICATVFQQIIPHAEPAAVELLKTFETALYKHIRGEYSTKK